VRTLVKSVSILALTGLLAGGCAAMAEQARKTDEARNACYQINPGDLYQETFALLSAAYPIQSDSESRGYIETGWGQPQWAIEQSRVTAQVTHTGTCTRVSMTAESKDSQTQAVERDQGVEDQLYLDLQKRVQQR
jgi:curved DNA-binding protein CbpA